MTKVSSNTNKAFDYMVIGLLSFGIVAFQITVTRLLSVVLWYHFAFLVISLAMLALGAPGVWFTIRQPRASSLTWSLYGAAASLPLSVVLIVNAASLLNGWLYIGLVVFSALMPMLFMGAGVCILLLAHPGRSVGSVYGVNLIGGALGAGTALLLMNVLPTPQLIAMIAFLPLCCVSLRKGSHWMVSAVMAASLLALVAYGKPLSVSSNKLYNEKEMGVLHEEWTPTGRIAVMGKCPYKNEQMMPWGWGYGKRFDVLAARELWIDQDGSAGMPVSQPGQAFSGVQHLLYDVTSIGYQLKSPERVAVIGAGGGRDILTALMTGAVEVDAVEINGAIVEALSGKFSEFCGDVYNMPGVNSVIGDGRSYLASVEMPYDLIQLSLVDTWSATAAGAYSLSENYLYTVQAFDMYLDRLENDGLLSVTRFVKGVQHIEGARMALLCMEVLRRNGAEAPEKHLAVAGGGKVGTFLLSPSPLSEDDLSSLRKVSKERGFDILWPAVDSAEESTVSRAIREGGGFLEEIGYDLRVPVDSRPFFFQSVPLLSRLGPSEEAFNDKSVEMLRMVVLIVMAAALVMFFTPFVFKGLIHENTGFWRGSMYFVCIGMGFMLIELPWTQRFILHLGHPSYAVAVVIGALLAGAGLGSIAASFIGDDRTLDRELMILPLAILVLQYVLGSIMQNAQGSALSVRCLLAILMLLPIGFVMGFAFPVGLRHYGDENKAWFLALNGFSGVLGSSLSLALAMMYGFQAVVAGGIFCYLLAVSLISLKSSRSR